MRVKKRLVATATAAVAVAALGAGSAASAGPIITLPDNCAIEAPDATLTLGALPSTRTSPGAAYAYPGNALACARFIVDVSVSPTNGEPFEIDGSYAGPSTGPLGVWGVGIPLSKSDCGLFRQYVTLYRKPWFTLSPPAKFSKLTSFVLKGKWYAADPDPVFGSPAHCETTLSSGTLPPGYYLTGNAPLGGATYRMAIAAKTSDWQRVKVHAAILPPPPG